MQISLARSLAYFRLAGLLEIGGGYLIWLWLPDGWDYLGGALCLVGMFVIMYAPRAPAS